MTFTPVMSSQKMNTALNSAIGSVKEIISPFLSFDSDYKFETML
jgi:hypothetical protein